MQSPVTWVGRAIYYCFPYRRRVMQANIQQVFGDSLNDAQKKHLMMAFYSHVLRGIREILISRCMSEKTLRSQVCVKGHEYLLDVAKAGQGILIVTGHMGNWELAPLGGILQFKEYQGQFHFIRRTLKIKWLENLLFRRYYKLGLRVIPNKNAIYQVTSALEKNNAVIFVLDQHASLKNKDGIAVEFFGKKAGTYRSLASIAAYTKVPVVPAAGYRLPNGQHVLEFHEPIVWQEYDSLQESIYRNTLQYNQALERMILEHPSQWVWLHKRWKLKPQQMVTAPSSVPHSQDFPMGSESYSTQVSLDD